jgi:hypothetical protein
MCVPELLIEFFYDYLKTGTLPTRAPELPLQDFFRLRDSFGYLHCGALQQAIFKHGLRKDRSLTPLLEPLQGKFESESKFEELLPPGCSLERLYGGTTSGRQVLRGQLFMLRALYNGSFDMIDADGVILSTSADSCPSFFGEDNRIIVSFRNNSRNSYWVVCDQYTGTPHAVINIDQATFFETSSTNRSLGNSPHSLQMLLGSMFLDFLSKLQRPRSDNPRHKIAIIGMCDNPAHTVWNYLGGLNMLRRCSLLDHLEGSIQTKHLVYPTGELLAAAPIQLSHVKPNHRYEHLLRRIGPSNIYLRFSDAGCSKHLAENLVSHARRQSGAEKIERTPNPDMVSTPTSQIAAPRSLGDVISYVNDYKPSCLIALQIRGRTRHVANQSHFVASLIQRLASDYPQARFVFDGPANIADGSASVETDILSESLKLLDPPMLGNEQRLINCIGKPLWEQVDIYKQCDSFLLYLSGGNVKFRLHTNAIGVLLAPKSPFADSLRLPINHIPPDYCHVSAVIRFLVSTLYPHLEACLTLDYSLLPFAADESIAPALFMTGSTLTDLETRQMRLSGAPFHMSVDAACAAIHLTLFVNISRQIGHRIRL